MSPPSRSTSDAPAELAAVAPLTPEALARARAAAQREDGSLSALLLAAELAAPLGVRAALTGPRWDCLATADDDG